MTDSSTPTAGTGRAAYWIATVLVCAELGMGGMWDVLRLPQVRDVVEHLGYPSYFLVLLGVWKLLGMIALLAPRLPLLKEWAYAGVFFTDTGAVVSHLAAGYAYGELAFLVPLAVLTVVSWALRPASRRVPASVRRDDPSGPRSGPRVILSKMSRDRREPRIGSST